MAPACYSFGGEKKSFPVKTWKIVALGIFSMLIAITFSVSQSIARPIAETHAAKSPGTERVAQKMAAGTVPIGRVSTGLPVLDHFFTQTEYYVEHPGQFLAPIIPYIRSGWQMAVVAHESVLHFMNVACGNLTTKPQCFGDSKQNKK